MGGGGGGADVQLMVGGTPQSTSMISGCASSEVPGLMRRG